MRRRHAARAPQPAPQPAQRLYTHIAHPHTPRNVNAARQEERTAGGVNQRLAVWLTAYVGTMWTAYGFAALAIVGLLGVLAILNPGVYTFIAWLSQTFIQLVLLPVIMVGQNVLNRHAELQADEMFATTQHSFHDIEQMMLHLDAQDAELLRQTELMQRMLARLAVTLPTTTITASAPSAPSAPGVQPSPQPSPTPSPQPSPAASPAASDTHRSHPSSAAASNSRANRRARTRLT